MMPSSLEHFGRSPRMSSSPCLPPVRRRRGSASGPSSRSKLLGNGANRFCCNGPSPAPSGCRCTPEVLATAMDSCPPSPSSSQSSSQSSTVSWSNPLEARATGVGVLRELLRGPDRHAPLAVESDVDDDLLEVEHDAIVAAPFGLQELYIVEFVLPEVGPPTRTETFIVVCTN